MYKKNFASLKIPTPQPHQFSNGPSFMQHTIVLGGSQKIYTFHSSVWRDPKIRNQAGFFVFDKFTWRQIWWRVNQPF